MNSAVKFRSVAEVRPPESAHPGYDEKEAQVIVSEIQTLHFLKGDDSFHVTLFYNPSEDGPAPAINLGEVSSETVAKAVKDGFLAIDGRRFQLLNTRLLRRIL